MNEDRRSDDSSWVLGWDNDWQYPAITEKHAFHMLKRLPLKPHNVTYLGFPWATYVDQKIQTPGAEERLLSILRDLVAGVPSRNHVVTVCQHIAMDRIVDEMIEAGVTHVFWTHHVKPPHDRLANDKITILPFPLYPVQVLDEPAPVAFPQAETERRYLFSFVGAHAAHYYLTQSRNHIIEHLGAHPKGHIVDRKRWHYHKIVYEYQIWKKAPHDQGLVNEDQTREFRESLFQSTFSLCPSGSGPNSIRLWESIGAGAIPVILADTYLPPGDPELWQAAAVFCRETPEAIRTLPYRLETLAADPRRLAAMRRAMRLLWLLYGPRSFVHDIQKLVIELSGRPPGQAQTVPNDPLKRLTDLLSEKEALSEHDSLTLLRACACQLLVSKSNPTREMCGNTPLGGLVARAREALPPDHPTVRHFEEVLQKTRSESSGSMGKGKAGSRSLEVYLLEGTRRTPFHRTPFRELFSRRVRFVEAPHQAHVLVAGSEQDLREHAGMLGKLMKERPDTRVVVVSEVPAVHTNPTGNTGQKGDLSLKERRFTHPDVSFTYRLLDHETSRIFHFDNIPYELLTNEDLLPLYQRHLTRWTGMKAGELLEHWKPAPVSVAFFADRLVTEDKDENDGDGDGGGRGNGSYRTRVAENVVGERVLKVGKGWDDEPEPWSAAHEHLGKLVTLDGRVRLLSSYESTHHMHHVSKNVFDALAVGAIPIYFAGPGHRVFEIIAPECLLNTFGLSPEDAARKIRAFEPDLACAEAWLETAARLCRTLNNIPVVIGERRRVVDTCVEELDALF